MSGECLVSSIFRYAVFAVIKLRVQLSGKLETTGKKELPILKNPQPRWMLIYKD